MLPWVFKGPRVLTPRDGLYGWGWVSLTRNREIAGTPKRERERLELRVDVVVLLLREVACGESEWDVFSKCVAWAERRVLASRASWVSACAEVHAVLEPLLAFMDWSLLSADELERVSSLGVLRDGVLSERRRRGAELLEAYGCDGVRHCRARRWRWMQWPRCFSGAVPLRCDVVCSPDTADHHTRLHRTRYIAALTALPRGVFRAAG